jgi:ATP-dependent HslUV protease ATP-binding subunit HslU
MVIYLPQQSTDEAPLLDELTPREIVAELDKHVVGQAGRRGDAEKHPHDRTDRRRENRDRTPFGEVSQFTLSQGGSE